MPENIRRWVEGLGEFRKTIFFKRWKCLCVFFLIFEGINAILIINLWNEKHVKTAVWMSLLIFVRFVVFWIVSWRLYIRPSVQISKIVAKKNVNFEGNCDTYYEYLEHIFALLDGSIEREYSVKLLQKQTEFEALKNQINPHFLYNTLDTIRGYALIENAPNTSHMIELLSRLFRYMIGQKNELITIGQEIGIIQDYIKIQEYRQNHHILLLQNIDSDLMEKNILNYKIPKMSLEPFVENAIKHGMRNLSKEFIITIQITSTRTRLLIHVRDNGKGMDTEKLAALNKKLSAGGMPVPSNGEQEGKGTGIALTNVNERIKLLYGDEYGITAQSALGFGTDFLIMLPLKENNYEK